MTFKKAQELSKRSFSVAFPRESIELLFSDSWSFSIKPRSDSFVSLLAYMKAKSRANGMSLETNYDTYYKIYKKRGMNLFSEVDKSDKCLSEVRGSYVKFVVDSDQYFSIIFMYNRSGHIYVGVER